MSHASDLIARDIDAYLAEHEQKDLLRLLTCGSVDDGKSTLIGRLLHDSNMIYQDTLAALETDSKVSGTTGEQVDLALLMDGLKAEREQGITIDVAYRYFSTAKRKFIIADTPGHVQYTRNMVTGASTAQLAVILVDARHGVLPQTKRHSYIASLLGIRHVVVAINKMDLVDWSQDRFEQIRAEYGAVATKLDLVDPYFLPMSALQGDNVVDASARMPWFDGLPLMAHLETVDVAAAVDLDHLRLPVQLVIRPDLDFRGFAGQIASGVLRPGDEVVALPSGVSSTIDRIVTFDGDLDVAGPGRSVTITLADEIDVSRGDLLVRPGEHPHRGHDLDAMLVWMAEEELQPGRQYLLQSVNGISNATVSQIAHRVDIDTIEREEAKTLALNDIARCRVAVDRELLFDRYRENRTTGSFILVDRLTNATVAAGMILGGAASWQTEPDEHLTRQRSGISLEERVARYDQRPATVLLTGLTGSGKSTIALALERRLFDRGRTTLRLDGENVRLGISKDLGFSAEDRSENLRRASEIARFANNQGIIAIMALVSPQAESRAQAEALISEERFFEVFCDAPVEVCRDRDAKGMYDAADRGEIERFPGVSVPYEPPTDPDVHLDTTAMSVEACVDAILDALYAREILPEATVSDPISTNIVPVSTNIVRAEGHVDTEARRRAFGHGAATVWFTGLSGSGKSTVAYAVERALVERGAHAFVLDGDNVRFGLNRDLGFSPDDRTENIRRIGEVCRLFHDAGTIVLSSFISPYRADRDAVRALHPEGGFIEVFVDTPIEVCEQRDVKGLYAKARSGEIADFSGVSAPYEAPTDPEVRLDTSQRDLDACVSAVLAELAGRGTVAAG